MAKWTIGPTRARELADYALSSFDTAVAEIGGSASDAVRARIEATVLSWDDEALAPKGSDGTPLGNTEGKAGYLRAIDALVESEVSALKGGVEPASPPLAPVMKQEPLSVAAPPGVPVVGAPTVRVEYFEPPAAPMPEPDFEVEAERMQSEPQYDFMLPYLKEAFRNAARGWLVDHDVAYALRTLRSQMDSIKGWKERDEMRRGPRASGGGGLASGRSVVMAGAGVPGSCDRIEEGKWAVIILDDGRGQITVPVALCPGVKEGDWVLVEMTDGEVTRVTVDVEATEAARVRIAGKLERLRRGGHLRVPGGSSAKGRQMVMAARRLHGGEADLPVGITPEAVKLFGTVQLAVYGKVQDELGFVFQPGPIGGVVESMFEWMESENAPWQSVEAAKAWTVAHLPEFLKYMHSEARGPGRAYGFGAESIAWAEAQAEEARRAQAAAGAKSGGGSAKERQMFMASRRLHGAQDAGQGGATKGMWGVGDPEVEAAWKEMAGGALAMPLSGYLPFVVGYAAAEIERKFPDAYFPFGIATNMAMETWNKIMPNGGIRKTMSVELREELDRRIAAMTEADVQKPAMPMGGEVNVVTGKDAAADTCAGNPYCYKEPKVAGGGRVGRDEVKSALGPSVLRTLFSGKPLHGGQESATSGRVMLLEHVGKIEATKIAAGNDEQQVRRAGDAVRRWINEMVDGGLEMRVSMAGLWDLFGEVLENGPASLYQNNAGDFGDPVKAGGSRTGRAMVMAARRLHGANEAGAGIGAEPPTRGVYGLGNPEREAEWLRLTGSSLRGFLEHWVNWTAEQIKAKYPQAYAPLGIATNMVMEEWNSLCAGEGVVGVSPNVRPGDYPGWPWYQDASEIVGEGLMARLEQMTEADVQKPGIAGVEAHPYTADQLLPHVQRAFAEVLADEKAAEARGETIPYIPDAKTIEARATNAKAYAERIVGLISEEFASEERLYAEVKSDVIGLLD